MEIQNINLADLRKKYANEDNNFCIKIRKYDEKKQNAVSDIVYYNGIKAFEINHKGDNENNCELEISDSIYNFNKENIASNEKIVEAITNLRKDMSKYFVKNVNSITMMISYAQYKNSKNQINTLLEKILSKIKDEINGIYDKYIEINDNIIQNIKSHFENQYEHYNAEEKILLEKYKTNEKKLKDLQRKKISYEIKLNNFYDKNLTKENLEKFISDITKIEFIFIRNFLFDENMNYKRLFTKPEFNSTVSIANEFSIEEFETSVKTAIKQYEISTRTEIEKKYQHYFMISKLLKNKLKDFNNIYRFEEEYYTNESSKSNENKGRIDCVFVKIDESTTNQYNTELYLIELKVDEKVIDGTNGINKHLIDIEHLKMEHLNKFIENLQNRISYRREALGNKKIDIKIDPNKIHFWTVIAISNQDNAQKVFQKLQKLTNYETVKDEVKKGMLPKESVVIDEQIEKTKKARCECEASNNSEIDVKFFFDKNITTEPYDLSINQLLLLDSPFKDLTKNHFLNVLKENNII